MRLPNISKTGAIRIRITLAVVLVASAVAGLAAVTSQSAVAVASDADGVSVAVQGNQLVDGFGHPLQLVGVDRSGTEYACVQGWGIFDGPSDFRSIAAIAAWHVNAVRIPLNEDCWLGINGVAPAFGGDAYRTAIENYVHELNQAGMVAIVDLHWGAPDSELATSQEMMPDQHATAFWQSVATTFESDHGVVFDLFNEPYGVSWSCWRDGCQTPAGYQAVGMQSLVDTVRATGATQPIMVEPLDWGADLSGFVDYAPVDPDRQLVASLHLYNSSTCSTESCWNSVIAPVASEYPIVTGELGEFDCADGFIDSYMAWADAHAISYLGWTWDAGGGWSCSSGPALIEDYAGDPTSFGAGFQSHLASLATVNTNWRVTDSWGNGGIGELTVTNSGSQPVGSVTDPWTIRFSLPGPLSVSSMWNAVLDSDSDGVVTAMGPDYAPALGPGQSISIGYVFGGGTAAPSEIDVDGAPTRP